MSATATRAQVVTCKTTTPTEPEARIAPPRTSSATGINRFFAFASYNCGSGNVAKARKEAAKRGLAPKCRR